MDQRTLNSVVIVAVQLSCAAVLSLLQKFILKSTLVCSDLVTDSRVFNP